jgi:thymidine phosphorylase
MVKAQGGDDKAIFHPELLPQAAYRLDVPAEKPGIVSRIHAEAVGLVSMKLGGGRATKEDSIDPAVGVVLHRKLGDAVVPGDSLATVFASDPVRGQEAVDLVRGCYEFSIEPVERPPFIKKILK